MGNTQLKTEKPLISVVIPTCNRPESLKRAIKSVLHQTYKNLEIIVIDDASTENYQKIIKCFDKKIVTYIKNKTRKGGAYSRNIGIKKTKGKFIAFLDDDDEWMPKKLEKQMAVFNDPNVGLAVCYSIDKRFDGIRISKPPKDADYTYLLKSFNLSSTSSYMVKKEVLDKVGYFDVDLPSAQEYDLALRITEYYSVETVPEVLMIQNASKGQISENWGKKIRGVLAIYSKYGAEYKRLGFKRGFLNHIVIVGMIGLFLLGYLFGNKIYRIIVPAKEYKEED